MGDEKPKTIFEKSTTSQTVPVIKPYSYSTLPPLKTLFQIRKTKSNTKATIIGNQQNNHQQNINNNINKNINNNNNNHDIFNINNNSKTTKLKTTSWRRTDIKKGTASTLSKPWKKNLKTPKNFTIKQIKPRKKQNQSQYTDGISSKCRPGTLYSDVLFGEKTNINNQNNIIIPSATAPNSPGSNSTNNNIILQSKSSCSLITPVSINVKFRKKILKFGKNYTKLLEKSSTKQSISKKIDKDENFPPLTVGCGQAGSGKMKKKYCRWSTTNNNNNNKMKEYINSYQKHGGGNNGINIENDNNNNDRIHENFYDKHDDNNTESFESSSVTMSTFSQTSSLGTAEDSCKTYDGEYCCDGDEDDDICNDNNGAKSIINQINLNSNDNNNNDVDDIDENDDDDNNENNNNNNNDDDDDDDDEDESWKEKYFSILNVKLCDDSDDEFGYVNGYTQPKLNFFSYQENNHHINLNFPKFSRQFDDDNYLRLEENAIKSLKLALKSCGKLN